jgi:hypothetical protein
VYYNLGRVMGVGKTADSSVRCVRGGPLHKVDRLVRTEPVTGQPVVADGVTGLMWQGCASGLSGSSCTGTLVQMRWQDALAYCQTLDWGGHTDWYLPDIKQYYSITDHSLPRPVYDRTAFIGTPNAAWWTSTSSNTSGSWENAWYVGRLAVYDDNKTGSSSSRAVRCARYGP